MKTIAIIPARYASTRFPGKPLARLDGREIILRVVERVQDAGFDCAVATDDVRIFDVVTRAGYKAVMTSENHRSGTDRIREALDLIEDESGEAYDVVINVQGDEPFVDTAQLRLLEGCFADASTDIATLVRPFDACGDVAELENPNLVKVVRDDAGRALYFSRSVVPYLRGVDRSEWPSRHQYYSHIGIYGYRADVLRKITELSAGALEQAESLEQLRWLAAGYTVMTSESRSCNIGIDTPADLAAAEEYLRSHPEK